MTNRAPANAHSASRKPRQTRFGSRLSLSMTAALFACTGGAQPGGQPGDPSQPTVQPVVTSVDYEQALRSAALKLTGNYPTLAEIKQVRDASDQKSAYALLLDDYLGRPSFAGQMVEFFRDTFKMGGVQPRGGQSINLDYAPAFAAMLVVKEQPIRNLLTATSGTCQTFTEATGEFTTVPCPNAKAVGVLTDAGVQAQFFSSMAFRRVRWVQETFACRKFPAENAGKPEVHPGGSYASPWAYSSITGAQNSKSPRVDFQDDKSIICANCHTTMNHLAPLFARFGENGSLSSAIEVMVPIPGQPKANLTDWLPSGEATAWRFGKPVADLTALGATIADDPDFPRCVANRLWNWALSRPNVVEDAATLSDGLGSQLSDDLVQNSWNAKRLIRNIFTSDSFVRY